MPDIPDSLRPDDHVLWLTIGLCVAMLFTLEAVEEAVDGAWPHQRRASRMAVDERRAHPIWGLAALLVLPGAVLAILTLATMAWKDLPRSDELLYGGALLAVGWAMFVLASIDRLRVRQLFTRIGPAAPLAVVVMLLAADILLLIAFTDIRPSVDSVRDALPDLR
jgi:hypothetical protein